MKFVCADGEEVMSRAAAAEPAALIGLTHLSLRSNRLIVPGPESVAMQTVGVSARRVPDKHLFFL